MHNAPLHNAKVMNRFELTRRLVAKLGDEAVIGGIGNANFDLWASGRRPENFYMLGSMGLAAPIALGFAIAQPNRRVFALEGDGSLLMQLGCLSTIAARAPRNLAVILWDNGVYQITGRRRPMVHRRAHRCGAGGGADRARSGADPRQLHARRRQQAVIGFLSPESTSRAQRGRS
jgi:thiamine pyrophosphate-dependent acetolactate synthase large subunit-like protein